MTWSDLAQCLSHEVPLSTIALYTRKHLLRAGFFRLLQSQAQWWQEEIDRPFQSLDFLVRDWRHFRPRHQQIAECWNIQGVMDIRPLEACGTQDLNLSPQIRDRDSLGWVLSGVKGASCQHDLLILVGHVLAGMTGPWTSAWIRCSSRCPSQLSWCICFVAPRLCTAVSLLRFLCFVQA